MKVVDIFKQYKCNELKAVQGKVFMKQDKYLNRRVIALDGNVTTSAVMTINCSLNHNYLHFQLFSEKIFMINVSVAYQGVSFRISISNLYKMIKYPSDTSVQVPCEPVQWGTIILDIKSFWIYQEITQIQLSGCLLVKNILNSNEIAIPADLQLQPVKRQPVGKTIIVKNTTIQEKENKQPHQQVQKIQDPKKGILKKSKYEVTDSPLPPAPYERVSPTKKDVAAFDEPVEETHFQIQPSPLLILKQIHGYTPSNQSNVFYIDDVYFVFPCQNQLIIMNQDTLEQKYCSTLLPIAAVAVHQKKIIAACDNKSFYKYQSDQKSINHVQKNVQQDKDGYISTACCEIVIFDYITCNKTAHYKLEGYYSIHSLDCLDNSLLITALDHLQRFCILYINDEIIQVKQICTFHIKKIKFINQTEFITIGKENIRYWMIKMDTQTFQGHCPFLGTYARETHFTDLLIQEKRVLATCAKGRIFQFIDKDLSGVWQVSEDAITSIKQFESFIITTHKDSIKYWRLDFSEIIREIKSDVEVIGCDSKSSLLCAFKNKSIAKISNFQLQYLVHSHQQDILDIAVVNDMIVTSSMDHSICVWSKAIQLRYQFLTMDALGVTLHGLDNQVLVGFDSGLLRVFDLVNYTVALEIDTKEEILLINGSQAIYLVSQKERTLVLNNKLQILRELKFHQVICSGLNSQCFYLANKHQIKLYTIDTITETEHLTLPLSSVDINEHHLILVSNGNIKRYNLQMNFLQEVITSVNYVKSTSNYIFTGGDQFQVFDYSFRGDSYGTPSKQIYSQKISKIVLGNNEIFSFVNDFIFMWQVRAPLFGEDQEIKHLQKVSKIDTFYDMQNPQKKKLEKEKLPQTQKNPKKQDSYKKHSPEQKSSLSPEHHEVKKLQQISPKQISPRMTPQKSPRLMIQDQIPRLKIKSVHGYTFNGPKIQQFPWLREKKMYLLPADQFLTINQLDESQKQYVILMDKILGIHEYKQGIVVIVPTKINIFTKVLDFVKVIDYVGNIVCAAVSHCGYYIAIIIDQMVQIIELTSGRILSQSVIQRGSSETYIEWVQGQELMFVILCGFSSQLWRLNHRSLLEYCDIGVDIYYSRTSCNVQIQGRRYLVIASGTSLDIVDIRQCKVVCTIQNVVNHQIIQIISSDEYLLLLTESTNIYYFPIKDKLDTFINTLQDPQILSLDGVPQAHSLLTSEIMIACQCSLWYVDLKSRVTLKIFAMSLGNVKCVLPDIYGTSEGSILIGQEEILVPKRAVLCMDLNGDIIYAGFDDGFLRVFQDFKLLGQVKIGNQVTSIKCTINEFYIGSENLYLGHGVKEITLNEIQKVDFPITAIDILNEYIAYSTANQKVQILQQMKHEEFSITKQKETTIEYFLLDSYKFRALESAYVEFKKGTHDQIIIGCNQIILRNFIEHLNLYVIDVVGTFSQFDSYLVIARPDGRVSLYDGELELDTIKVSQSPVTIVKNHLLIGSLVCKI